MPIMHTIFGTAADSGDVASILMGGVVIPPRLHLPRARRFRKQACLLAASRASNAYDPMSCQSADPLRLPLQGPPAPRRWDPAALRPIAADPHGLAPPRSPFRILPSWRPRSEEHTSEL